MSASPAETTTDPRTEVVQCEREIQAIKTALRKAASRGEETPNSLQVTWTELQGGGDGALVEQDVEVSLQLSSPVEEAVLHQPSSAGVAGEEAEAAAAAEGEDSPPSSKTTASFSGVETSMATLTVTLQTKDNGIVLGTSESYDLAPLCSLSEDVMNPKDEYVFELPVAIVAPATEQNKAEIEAEEESPKDESPKEGDEANKEETKEDIAEKASGDSKEENEDADTKENKDDTAAKIVKPLCSLTLRLVFKPSAKDQKEELYELLNKTSLRKSQALERLRDQQESAVTSTTGSNKSSSGKQPAVKAGFLNKKSSKSSGKPPQESKWKQWYDKYLGPKSLARGLVFPIAKNYIIFFGAVALAHFKGQELALPAPV